MKKIFFLFVVCVGLYTSGCKEAVAQNEGIVQVIPVAQFEEGVRQDGAQLIDVRTISEFNEGHIEGAQNIVFRSKEWNAAVKQLDMSKPVYVYCAKGGRSAKCAKLLKESGFKQVYDLDGGITNWKREGKVIE